MCQIVFFGPNQTQAKLGQEKFGPNKLKLKPSHIINFKNKIKNYFW